MDPGWISVRQSDSSDDLVVSSLPGTVQAIGGSVADTMVSFWEVSLAELAKKQLVLPIDLSNGTTEENPKPTE